MSQSLPDSDFKFLTQKEINNFDLDSISENSQTGYILECDLKYPEELHELLNDYPLRPEKIEVNSDMLSKYCCEVQIFKLLINCVYGKSMGNIRKRTHIKLINDQKKYLRCVNKPNFISQKIFDKYFVAVHCVKTILTLNKPIYLGFSILELNY